MSHALAIRLGPLRVQLTAVTLDKFEAAADKHGNELLTGGRFAEAAAEFERAARADRALAEMTDDFGKHHVLTAFECAVAAQCEGSWLRAAAKHSELAATARGRVVAPA